MRRPLAPAPPVRARYPRLRAAWRLLGWPALLLAASAHADSTLPPSTAKTPRGGKGDKGDKPAPNAAKKIVIPHDEVISTGGVIAMPEPPTPPTPVEAAKAQPAKKGVPCRLHPHGPGEACLDEAKETRRVLVVPPLPPRRDGDDRK